MSKPSQKKSLKNRRRSNALRRSKNLKRHKPGDPEQAKTAPVRSPPFGKTNVAIERKTGEEALRILQARTKDTSGSDK